MKQVFNWKLYSKAGAEWKPETGLRTPFLSAGYKSEGSELKEESDFLLPFLSQASPSTPSQIGKEASPTVTPHPHSPDAGCKASSFIFMSC